MAPAVLQAAFGDAAATAAFVFVSSIWDEVCIHPYASTFWPWPAKDNQLMVMGMVKAEHATAEGQIDISDT